MKAKFFILYLALITNACAFLPFEEGGKEKWELSMKDGFLRLDAKPIPEQISYLSDLLFALHGTYRSEQTEEIRNEATNLLVSIPGHAKFYQNKIEKMRTEVLENSKKSPSELVKMQDAGIEVIDVPTYLSETERAIRTLRFMPSAETVSVLGQFLNDPLGRDGKTLLDRPLKRSGDSAPALSNAHLATEIIRTLGIERPPFRDTKGVITPEEIDAWKDWWNEVKEGKRTYRFIGSQIEYGPEGPATRAVVQRVERDQKRDGERQAGLRKSTTITDTNAGNSTSSAAKPLSIAGILAACCLMVGASWYYLRSQRAA
jgi:hypothetical protein